MVLKDDQTFKESKMTRLKCNNQNQLTTIEQFHRLQSIAGNDNQENLFHVTSAGFIEKKGVEASGLTLNDFFALGVPIRDTKSGGWDRVALKEDEIEAFKLSLGKFIASIQGRIEWLMSGCHRVFGRVIGRNICFLVDCSEMNFYGDREEILKDSLKALLDEQLKSSMRVQFMTLNEKVNTPWNKLTLFGDFQKEEALKWIELLRADEGCNLLQALRCCFKDPSLDTICIILGSRPDQDADIIIDFVKEKFVGRDINIHAVDFNSKSYETKMLLKELTKEMDGRYQSFTDDKNHDLMSCTDTFLLSQELKRAVIILSQVEELVNGGMIQNTQITIKKNPKESKKAWSLETTERQRLRNEYERLNMDPMTNELHSSADWLKMHGLKAKGLTLYQVMAPNAYSYVKSYVPSLAKNVQSKVHHQSMVQMEWHDGSLKNVHIDPVLLFSYQHHLQNALQVFEKRVQWLQCNSRKYYGCIVQKSVVFLVDLSTSMQYGLGELQLSLKQLMEEQIGLDMMFNMVCIGNDVRIFNDKMLKATLENVSACWRWFSRLTCVGPRKCLQAFSYVLHEYAINDEVDGIYFITSGIPNEPEEVLSSFIREALHGLEVSVNCILFGSITRSNFAMSEDIYENVDDTARYLRGIAHENQGRFHWIDDQVIVESDDIRLIQQEMSHANNYLNKTKILFTRLRSKATNKQEKEIAENKQVFRPTSSRKKMLLSPKHTALSSSRIQRARPSSSIVTSKKEQKKLPWRPSTAKSSSNLIPNVKGNSKEIDSTSPNCKSEFHQQVFYTEIGNDIGTTIHPKTEPQSAACNTTSSKIPEKEELLSSKDWLQKYSLQMLKLNFNSVVSMATCDHVNVATINKNVDARHCAVFPKVELKGVMKHIYSRMKELTDYKIHLEKALQRYIKRLKWLLKDSKHVFGTILEKNVVIVIDLSGSMMVYKQQLDEQFSALVWQQLFKGKKHFSVICFSSNTNCWQSELVEANKQNCTDVIAWFHSQQCRGTTATLEAVQNALSFSDVQGVYLTSDGKPDCSKSNVLRRIANFNMEKKVKIHTIAYKCNDSEESAFLKLLAAQSKGRYSQYQDGRQDVEEWMNSILDSQDNTQDSTPDLLVGDDVKMIYKEITTAKRFLHQCNACILAVEEWKKETECRRV